MFLVVTSLKANLESVVTCWAVADGQASADEVVLDVDDQKSADGANDLIENNFFWFCSGNRHSKQFFCWLFDFAVATNIPKCSLS